MKKEMRSLGVRATYNHWKEPFLREWKPKLTKVWSTEDIGALWDFVKLFKRGINTTPRCSLFKYLHDKCDNIWFLSDEAVAAAYCDLDDLPLLINDIKLDKLEYARLIFRWRMDHNV